MPPKHSKFIDNVGRRIAEVRRERGWTQDYLADKAGVTGGYIRQIEGGQQNLSLGTLEWLAGILKCKPTDLFQAAKPKKRTAGRPQKIKP
jgi:transcriptional regulator with XRE-family HTH domain